MVYCQHKVLIFGGAGSLGKTLVKRFKGNKVYVFSRDEAKHHYLKQSFPEVNCIIGDIRDYDSVLSALQTIRPTIIINCSALKQVPACEFYPYEALKTNAIGSHNLVKAIENYRTEIFITSLQPTIKVLSISTDKACKPVNAYGMTKALQERIHLNGSRSRHIFNCVRYGNVLESTGSIIPVFKKLIDERKPLTITDERMTRFLLSLEQAVDLIFTALKDEKGGKVFIPKVPSAKITDLAKCLTPPNSTLKPKITGIRPGEKIHEILVSEEELMRTEDLGDVFVIHDIKSSIKFDHLKEEYSSKSDLMVYEELTMFLAKHGVYDK